MNSVTREVTIHASRQKVWDVLADIGAVDQYSQNVENSSYVSPNTSGLGAARKCEIGGSSWLKEEAIAWQENRGYTLQVTDGDGLGSLDSLLVAFELSDVPQGTKVSQTMTYNMKGPLRPILNKLSGGQFRKAIDVNLNGLKTFVEAN